MATLRNKRKLAAMVRQTQAYPRNMQSKNSPALGITEDYIAQISKQIEGRVIEKLSQEFSRTEPRILGALSKLDEFLFIPQIGTFFGTVPGTLWNVDVENREPGGNRCQSSPQAELQFTACRASNITDSDPNGTSHKRNNSFSNYTQEKFERPLFREVLLTT